MKAPVAAHLELIPSIHSRLLNYPPFTSGVPWMCVLILFYFTQPSLIFGFPYMCPSLPHRSYFLPINLSTMKVSLNVLLASPVLDFSCLISVSWDYSSFSFAHMYAKFRLECLDPVLDRTKKWGKTSPNPSLFRFPKRGPDYLLCLILFKFEVWNLPCYQVTLRLIFSAQTPIFTSTKTAFISLHSASITVSILWSDLLGVHHIHYPFACSIPSLLIPTISCY